jgi:amino acid transporter
MLKINQIFMKLFFLILIVIVLFFIAGYFSFKLIIVDTQNVAIYNQIWLMLGVLATFMILLIYFSIKNISTILSKDVEELQNYLNEINNKNYDAIIKINTFQEFLRISLLLKNIVKRVNQKEKKSAKK